MKYSDYYFSPNTRRLSTVLGFVVGVVSALIFGWQVGLIAGAGSAILLSFLLPLVVYRADAPYEKLKATIQGPFLIDERVQFAISNGTVMGCMLLTAEKIILLSLDRGEHRLELNRDEVLNICMADRSTLRISLGDSQYVRVISGACAQMFRTLYENGWNTTVYNNEND